MKQIYIQKGQNFYNTRIQNSATALIFNSVTWMYMVYYTPTYETDNIKYTHCKQWPIKGVSSAANSESTHP
jgi:hypothetical protein